MQGNPIRLTDPFGLCPDISLTRIGYAALDLLGIIPRFDGCDGINTVWYLIEGDYANAATSAVAAFPLLGSIIGSGIKWGAKGVANAEKIADGIRAGSRIIGNAGALIQSGSQTLESVGNLYDSYVKDGEVISWKNATDLITLGLSVAGMGMAGKSLAKDGKALKAVSQGNVNVKPAAVSNSTGSSNIVQTINNKFPNDNQVGKRFNFTTENGRIHIDGGVQNVDFVIDMDGNLHLGRGHSYLSDGSSVQAAGTIKVNSQGYIRLITNESGHFQPTTAQALNYPTVFKNAGLTVDNAWMRIGEFKTSMSNYVIDSKVFYNGPIKNMF